MERWEGATSMSVRAVQGQRKGQRKGQLLTRLDEVLSIGADFSVTAADSEGLTRALKRTSLVPTGVVFDCMERRFDPDYCAYDPFYAVGVAVVSAVIGTLASKNVASKVVKATYMAIHSALDKMCYTPPEKDPDGYLFSSDPFPGFRSWRDMSQDEVMNHKEISTVCKVLDASLRSVLRSREYSWAAQQDWKEEYENGNLPMTDLVFELFSLVLTPSQTLRNAGMAIDDIDKQTTPHGSFFAQTISSVIDLAMIASIPATLQYLARYMSEHALMVASFLRVNSKLLKSGEDLILDVTWFARMCKEDITKRSVEYDELIAAIKSGMPFADQSALFWKKLEAEREMRQQAYLVDEVMKMPTIMASFDKPAIA